MSSDQRPGQGKIVNNGKLPLPSARKSALAFPAISGGDEPAERARWLSNGVIGVMFCAATVGSAAVVAALFKLPL